MLQNRRESSRNLHLGKLALFLAGLGVCLSALASACATGASGGGSGDESCNEDDVCDDEEDCDCSDCSDTSFCDGNASTTATTGASTSGATTATSSTTGGGGVVCADVSDTSVCLGSDQAACLCLGCPLAVCDDGAGNYNDCVCANCAADPYCSDPANCMDDGECHPGLEGCICADCVGHPLCQ